MIPNQNNSLYQELFSDDDISSPYEIKEKETKEIIEKNEKSKKEEEDAS